MRVKHHIALWAGMTAFFSNLVAIQVIAILGDEQNGRNKAIAALITSLIVAGVVYSRQRLMDAKEERARLIDGHHSDLRRGPGRSGRQDRE